MQYEEYRDRMVAQGRTPAARERYASQVEAGYMLANLTPDEFCQLPDRVIAELSRAANRCAEYARRADAAAQEADSLRHKAAELAVEAEAEAKERRAVLNEAGRLRDALAERDALIERLLQAMTADQTRRFMLAQMAAREEA
jgi:uncharacterized coiled-coil DUF342 family protein